jgi:hypothetical protein
MPEFFDKYTIDILDKMSSIVMPKLESHKKELSSSIWNTILSGIPHKGVRRDGFSEEEQAITKLFWGYSEISNSFERLKDIEFYINKFPYSNKTAEKHGITKENYLRFVVEAYLHEMYILQERLKSYLNVIRKLHKHSNSSESISLKVEKIKAIVILSLGNIIKSRGRHVHVFRFEDSDIAWLSTSKILTMGNLKNDGKIPYSMVYKEVRKKWLKRIKEINIQTEKLLDIYFKKLYPLVFDNKRNFIFLK